MKAKDRVNVVNVVRRYFALGARELPNLASPQAWEISFLRGSVLPW